MSIPRGMLLLAPLLTAALVGGVQAGEPDETEDQKEFVS
jgi:hypothetical protein